MNSDAQKQFPSVSIVIPIYNTESYLEECLDSVVNQTLKNIEIICVNDGSTDASLKIIENYAQKDERIIIIDKANSGYGDSMNVGISRASGEYIGIVEPDDYIALDMYSVLYSKASELDLDVIKADYHFVSDEEGSRLLQYQKLTKRKKYYHQILCPGETLETFNFMMNTWSGIYKRSFLEQHGIRHNVTPGASYQDTGFWFQTMMFAKKFYIIDRHFYHYRVDNMNASMHDKGKVYFINQEFAYIRNILEADELLFEKFISIFHYRKFRAYFANYKRIGDEFKLEFLETVAQEMREAEQNGELELKLFDRRSARRVKALMKSPRDFHHSRANKAKLARFFGIYMERAHGKRSLYILWLKVFAFRG